MTDLPNSPNTDLPNDDLRKTITMPDKMDRREFVGRAMVAGSGLAAGGLTTRLPAFAEETKSAEQIPLGKAQQCIMLWLGGGACHIDTWDPKRLGDAKAKRPGSYYKAIPTTVEGTSVCEHLPRCAKLLDRFNVVRSVHHEVIDEHAAAVNRVHTGRPVSGTITYPSIGSVVYHQLGPRNEKVPGYVLIGYPNVTRGPGFLGAECGYLYLTDTRSGPAGLTRPADVSSGRASRRAELLAQMRQRYRAKLKNDQTIATYDTALAGALRLAGPDFTRVFELERESAALRQSYGSEFGQRCLLARRLLQSGVRFVEVSHNLNFVNGTGWDTHNDGQLQQHELIRELDQALGSLVEDLERHDMLDQTLIVVATEFGRPAGFDGGGGRGHHSKAFSMVLAGGGLRTGKTIGTTDELGMEIVDRPVSIPDFHATIYHALGIDSTEEMHTSDDRPVPITDGGRPIAELFG